MAEEFSELKKLLLSANVTEREYFINSSSKIKMEQLIESKIQLLNDAKQLINETAAKYVVEKG